MTLWTSNKLWILLSALLFLTACPDRQTPGTGNPSLSLSALVAAPGSPLTATLSGLSATGASVTVAAVQAQILSTESNKITFQVPTLPKEKFGEQAVVVSNGAVAATGTITIVEGSFKLSKKRASRGEQVTATVEGLALDGMALNFAGAAIAFEVRDATRFTFTVPADAPLDLQPVSLQPASGTAYSELLGVLGNVAADQVTLIVKAGTSEASLRQALSTLGFSLEGNLVSLGGGSATCSGQLANIDVGGTPLGEALSELEALEQNGQGITLFADPRSGWDLGSVDYLGATGAPLAHARTLTGAGTLIAVLDTGVSPHSELGSRFRSDLSFDFIANDAMPEDSFDDPSSPGLPLEGHGTPIAVVAAGSQSGVAPEAEVMGVKVCGQDGCPSSKVIQGVCHVLANAPDPGKTIINLSLGGDTPVLALEAILREAINQGVVIAAAAGNQGATGSPIHYPAAHFLEGLVAVGALESASASCVDFEGLATTSYPLNQSFVANGITVTVKPFYPAPGQPARTGTATIMSTGLTGGVGQALDAGDTNLAFGFDYPLDGVTLRYEELGSIVNLDINGTRLVTGGMTELNANTGISGVSISVVPDATDADTGMLYVSGAISSFAIGGMTQEFLIDDVCPLTRSSWQAAPFSTRGIYVDIAAPGVGIRSGIPNGSGYFGNFQGTSFATPQVAGALALWRQAEPDSSAADLEFKLKAAASPLTSDETAVGSGLLNLSKEP